MDVTLRAITLDCADPKILANFYHELTGMKVVHSDDSFVGLETEGGLWVGFQRVDDYRPPQWPDQQVPQQFHIDFAVPDLDEGEKLVLALGADKPEIQPGGERWRVFTDPAGHPFCLSPG